MIELDRYIPSDPRETDDLTAWDEHHDRDYEPDPPECSSHHTYRQTVPLHRFQIWVCPYCGRYSDRHADHTGGRHITSPVDVDTDRVLVVVGRATLPPSADRDEPFGDGTVDAGLVSSPYEARNDIKAFKSDVEWHPETGGSTRYRRWVPDWKVWEVNYSVIDEFVDHMDDRDWIVINLQRLSPPGDS